MVRLPGDGPLSRSLAAVAVYAVFLLLLVAVATVANRIVSTGHTDVTPSSPPPASSLSDTL